LRNASESDRGRVELDLLRLSLLRAGLQRDEEELQRLLPRFRVLRESDARIGELPLEGTEPQVVFDPRWSS
jgi:hypothetical protein